MLTLGLGAALVEFSESLDHKGSGCFDSSSERTGIGVLGMA